MRQERAAVHGKDSYMSQWTNHSAKNIIDGAKVDGKDAFDVGLC